MFGDPRPAGAAKVTVTACVDYNAHKSCVVSTTKQSLASWHSQIVPCTFVYGWNVNILNKRQRYFSSFYNSSRLCGQTSMEIPEEGPF